MQTLAILDMLQNMQRGVGGTLQLNDGITKLLDHEYAHSYTWETTIELLLSAYDIPLSPGIRAMLARSTVARSTQRSENVS